MGSGGGDGVGGVEGAEVEGGVKGSGGGGEGNKVVQRLKEKGL